MDGVLDYRTRFQKYVKRIEEILPVLNCGPRRRQDFGRSVIFGMIKEEFSGG
jgi:hypothetical protein